MKGKMMMRMRRPVIKKTITRIFWICLLLGHLNFLLIEINILIYAQMEKRQCFTKNVE